MTSLKQYKSTTPFGKRIRWKLIDGWTVADERLRSLFCKIFGHKKPYAQKLTAELCPRCFMVMKRRETWGKLPIKWD